MGLIQSPGSLEREAFGVREGHVTMVTDVRERSEDAKLLALKIKRNSYMPRNVGSIWNLEKARKWILL